ncbi:MAG: hypothetical protein LIP01_06215 [Tannerellaceae bacterium]|nr:hypothetical protein [Tannerellaceae bacterium]
MQSQTIGKKLTDLVTNSSYKTNATALSNKIKEENGTENFCNYIEKEFGSL